LSTAGRLLASAVGWRCALGRLPLPISLISRRYRCKQPGHQIRVAVPQALLKDLLTDPHVLQPCGQASPRIDDPTWEYDWFSLAAAQAQPARPLRPPRRVADCKVTSDAACIIQSLTPSSLGDATMHVLLATIAVLTVLTAPTVVRAQVNYDLLPGYGGGGRSFARVISFRENKIYTCAATTDPKAAPTLSCTPLPGNYTLLNGSNVKTIQTRSTFNTTGPWDAFWQIDQVSGEVNFCSPGRQPTAQTCVSSKIP
jgi:hypothetical protein